MSPGLIDDIMTLDHPGVPIPSETPVLMPQKPQLTVPIEAFTDLTTPG